MTQNPLANLSQVKLSWLAHHATESETRANKLHWLLGLEWADEERILQRKERKVIDYVKRRQPTYLVNRTVTQNRPAWYVAKAEVGKDLRGFAEDVKQAWDIAIQTGQAAKSRRVRGEAIAYQYSYAFVNASINTVASDIPLSMVPMLVENGVWESTQALAYVQRVPDEQQRAGAFIKLAPYLKQVAPKVIEQQVLEQIERIESRKERSTVLVGLVKYLPESLLQQALNIALALEAKGVTDNFQLTAIKGLAPYLSESLLQKVLETLDSNWSDYDAVQLLTAISDYLSVSQIRQALEIAKGSHLYFAIDQMYEAQAALLPCLAQKGFPVEAWAMAEEIYNEGWQVVTRARTIPHLPQEWRAKAVTQLVETVQRQGWIDYTDESNPGRYPILRYPKEGAVEVNLLNNYKPEQIAELLTNLPDDLFQQGLDIVIDGWDTYYGAWILPKMLNSLSGDRREEALKRILLRMQGVSSQDYKFRNERRRAKAFAELIPFLSQATMRRALDIVQEFDDTEDQILALKPLISHLPRQLRNEAIELVLNIDPYLYMRLDTLAEWAHFLDEVTLQKVLDEATKISDAYRRALILSMIIPALSEPLQGLTEKQVWEAIEEIDNNSVDKIAALVPYLSKDHQKGILARTLRSLKIEDKEEWTWAYIHLASYLPNAKVNTYLPEVIQAVDAAFPRTARESLIAASIQEQRERALTPLLPLLARHGMIKQVLELAEEREGQAQVVALAGLVAYLPKPLREQIFWRSYAMAQAYGVIGDWAEALRSTSLSLSKPMLWQLAKMIEDITDEVTQARTIVALAKHLPKSSLSKLYQIAASFKNIAAQVEVLTTIVHYLPKSTRNHAIQQLQTIAHDRLPADLVARIAPWLPETTVENLLRQTLTSILEHWKRDDNQVLLRTVLPCIPLSLVQEALEMALAFKEPSDQVLVMAGLVARLPKPQCTEIAIKVSNKLPKARLNRLGEAQVLGEILLFLPEQLQDEVIERAFGVLARMREEFRDSSNRNAVAKMLAHNLAQLPPAKLYPAWYKELRTLANQDRKALLNSLEDFLPMVVAMGSKTTVESILQAVLRTREWWQ